MAEGPKLGGSDDLATESHDFRGDSGALLDAMPVAMFVMDQTMTVAYVNDRLVDLIGSPREEIVGKSVTDYIDERDVEFAFSLLDASPEYAGLVMGPVRIRYIDADGDRHYTQFWSSHASANLKFDGFIISLSGESVRDVLATAVTSVASDEPLDRTLLAVASAGRASPLDGIGTMLVVEPIVSSDKERFRLIGDWPLGDEMVNAYGTPWRRCLVQASAQDVINRDTESAAVGAEMAAAGLDTAWVRPVFGTAGEVAAVFVLWRDEVMAASPNQEIHLDDAIRLAHLALVQAEHRSNLELAATRDALTGVGNRASLNDRIELERRHPSVLFIDLDNFKGVNDTFGHGVGDEVIAQVGRRISATVRRGDDVFRTGGDEFIVICDPDSDGANELLALADRLIETLAAAFDCNDHRVRIGATIGIASGRTNDGVKRSLQDAIFAADRAMYVAKERGRGCVFHADAPQ